MKMKENSKKGVDTWSTLKSCRNNTIAIHFYPLVPEKKIIEKRLMAVYLKRLMEDLKVGPTNSKKLVLTLEDVKSYEVHYRRLQFYLKGPNQQNKGLRHHVT